MTGRRISRGSNRPGIGQVRLTATALLAGFGALTALTACGTGQYAQTANQVPGVPGANVNVGPSGAIQLRNVVIQYHGPQGYPVGGSAPLVVRIFNAGPSSVTLVGVDAPGAATAVSLTGPEPTAPVPTPSPTAPVPTPTQTASAAATPTGSAAATPTASPSPTPITSAAPGVNSFSIEIASQAYATLVPGQGRYLVLAGLTRPIIPGDNVAVTFRFADGTATTLSVPVDLPAGPASRDNPISGENLPQD